ncbi:hypothetical protein DMB95_03840 [Campylobacter sp. MIT 12-8780]|uniref:ABC-type transport auxiliary lipoprotein family protein n=1 Tax=unclassified Campylobacter TaxID=2593542 RepID=UPI00115D4088|nr:MULTISPECIES: ABC-type transport auxiliary lipoprotein family protein [unclassified Campylobacter]NDJ27209.1 hypothetical protein [Campylobacter sp. MIT 19-121]TQR41496.1 hypothetical protein DMB95_03840 [Campylobacter sp. MIT 12-8780]
MKAKAIKSIFLLSISLLFISACSLSPKPQPALNVYLLQSDESMKKLSSVQNKVLKINAVQALLYLKSNEIAYIQNGEFGIYAKHIFKSSPSSAFEALLAYKLEQSELFKAVLSYNTQANADLFLESRLHNFEQVFEKDKSFVNTALSVNLIDAKNNKILAHKHFKFQTNIKEQNINAVIEAFNTALNQLGNEVVFWLENEIKTAQ